MADCPAYRLGGQVGQASVSGEYPCDFSVGGRLAVGDLLQDIPDGEPEGGADRMERGEKGGFFSREIGGQPFFGLCKYGRGFFRMFRLQARGIVFRAVKPESGQAGLVGGEENIAQGGGVMGNVLHGECPFRGGCFEGCGF